MIILPDGAKLEMQWKQIKYINHNSYILFQIIPMLNENDVIIVPNKEKWRNILNEFSFLEREQIIFLLEHINWKRDVKIAEMNIEPYLNKEINYQKGMIESTQGYNALSRENLFDVDSKLNKTQVKELYCKLEEKFAMMSKGIVSIPKEILIKGSVEKEICIPAFEVNQAVKLVII